MRGALVLLPAIMLLAGCGSDPSSFEGSDDALKDAGSSRVEYRWTGLGSSFAGVGAIDYAHDRGELVISSEEMELPGGEMQVRFIGATTYVGFTLLGRLRWEKQTEDAPTGTDQFVPGPGGPNADQLLEMLTEASKGVDTVGSEEIRGVPSTHYRAHLDPKKLGEDVSDLPEELVADAWIDGDGLLQRLRLPIGDGATMTVDLYDFGVKVDVEAPPADELVSEDEMTELMEKDCAGRKIRENDFCAMSVGGEGSGTQSYDEGQISPTETMPRTVTESR